LPAAGLTFVLARVSKTICGAELGIHASNMLRHTIPEIPIDRISTFAMT
jgi:hypothetical protein